MSAMKVLLWLWIVAWLAIGPYVAFSIWAQPVFDEIDKIPAASEPSIPLFSAWCAFAVSMVATGIWLL